MSLFFFWAVHNFLNDLWCLWTSVESEEVVRSISGQSYSMKVGESVMPLEFRTVRRKYEEWIWENWGGVESNRGQIMKILICLAKEFEFYPEGGGKSLKSFLSNSDIRFASFWGQFWEWAGKEQNAFYLVRGDQGFAVVPARDVGLDKGDLVTGREVNELESDLGSISRIWSLIACNEREGEM